MKVEKDHWSGEQDAGQPWREMPAVPQGLWGLAEWYQRSVSAVEKTLRVLAFFLPNCILFEAIFFFYIL